MGLPATAPSAATAGATRGTLPELLSLVGSITRHLQGLAGLAGYEGKDAAAHYIRIAVMLVAALVFAVFGYVLLLLFVAFLLAAVFKIQWLWITLGFAVLHFAVTAICALYVRRNFYAPLFPATSAEISKDIEALKRLSS